MSRMQVVRDGDLIPDNRLGADARDLLEHKAIAKGVAEIAWAADAPVNIALFGAWGSGKSSVYSMIEKHLKDVAPGKVRIARYDAWKYGGRELKRNFIDSVARELGIDETAFAQGLEQPETQSRLKLGTWVVKNWVSLLLGVGLAAVVAALWVLVQAGAVHLFTDTGFKAAARALVGQAGTVFGLSLVAALVGPKVLEGAVVTTTTPAPEGADQFAKRFKELVEKALKGRSSRLVVFIDELDRCDPKDVVATLIDLKTFLDQPNCVFIVAADRDVIERALREVPQAKPVREDEPYYATPGAFLDKIFQHQLALPPLRSRALTRFAHDLVDDQGGIWSELRGLDADDDWGRFNRTVFALIPVHVRSPRRVKVLLNNFATNARIAQSRDLDWRDRAEEIAVLTVLQTEFAAVADDLRRAPRLLAYLRREDNATGDLAALVNRYQYHRSDASADNDNDSDSDPSDSAAGELLSDTSAEPGPAAANTAGTRELEVANTTLRRHLSSYLAKVAAAGIRDPRPDLLYLQSAGGREKLDDPKLTDLIDLATDTAPDTVVDAFTEQPSKTLAIAIPLLVIEGDGEPGPGQQFAYESAARLVPALDPDDQGPVAHDIAPSLIAAVRRGTLPDAALAGAVLAAIWSGADDVVRQALADLADDTSEELLDRLTVLLPYLNDRDRPVLVTKLAENVGARPQPLLSALSDVDSDGAVSLWREVSGTVLTALNELELPEPDPDEPPAAPAATSRARTAAQAVAEARGEPVPTGEGVEVLNRIVDVVRERNDHETLLSAVVSTFQSPAAVAPLRAWVVEHIDTVLASMASPSRRAMHALDGLRYDSAHGQDWDALLPTAPRTDPDDRADDEAQDAAVDEPDSEPDVDFDALVDAAWHLLETLISTFPTTPHGGLDDLKDLTMRVAGWTYAETEALASTVPRMLANALANIGWTGAKTDNADAEELWARKQALLDLTKALLPVDADRSAPESQEHVDHDHDDQSNDPGESVFTEFANDLGALLQAQALTEYAITNWQDLARQLPERAAQTLSDLVDAYEPDEGEEGAVLRLQLTVRAITRGNPPPAADILALPEAERTTSLVDAWLALHPVRTEAQTVLANASATAGALRTYAAGLSTDDRTHLWVAVRSAGIENQVLSSIGGGGVGPDAVTAATTDVRSSQREPDRADLVRQLLGTRPAADTAAEVKKAASELANYLLDKDTTGDFRSAAELVLWAGGAGHGHVQALRQRFTDGSKSQRANLPRSVEDRLIAQNLLPRPKKRSIFRGR